MSEAEDVARRFEQRNGFELIDYAPVALPLLRLTVDAVTMVHHEIPPIREFVMRSVENGLEHPEEVSGFLGLDRAIVGGVVDQILADRYATLGDDGGLALTPVGRDVLAKARESFPRDEMLVFLYDRLLRKPVRLGPDQVLAPTFVDPQRVIEIRPYPAEGPSVEELPLPDVLQVLAEQSGGRAAFGRDLLRLKRIARRVRLFRPAVALVFKKSRSSELHIEFVVEDVRHEALSNAFAERGGPKKMGFVRSIDESSANVELRRHLGATVQKLLPPATELDRRRVDVSVARIKRQAAAARLERINPGNVTEVAASKASLAAAVELVRGAEVELGAFAARSVAPFEIPELLERALRETRSLLMVSTRALCKSVVDKAFLAKLEAILRRGARVVVSMTDEAPGDGPALDLERLRAQLPKLELVSGMRDSLHHLVSDDAFALVTNRPLLGNQGKVRIFSHVVGYLLQRPDLVEGFTERLKRSGADVLWPGARDVGGRRR